jgi:hypothetical protein
MLRAPVGMMTVNLDGVSHEAASGALIAHEMGHIIGNRSLLSLLPFYMCKRKSLASLGFISIVHISVIIHCL